MSSKQVEQCVEQVCQYGCAQVWQIIAQLERDEPIAEAAALTAAERGEVISELRSIMSVYGDRCSL